MAERRVREPPDDRVPDHPFGTAFPAPRVRLGDAALDHRALRLESLADGLKAEFVEAAESGQARCGEGSVEQRRGLSDGQLRNFHPGRPRHLSGDRRAAPTYTLNCEEPDNLAAGLGIAEKVVASFSSCPIPEIARLGRTLKRWKDAFLAYFTTGRANNGGTEAICESGSG
ncbi:hypothetical protein JOF34_001650 [Microbacterium amylolyticum]|uniref:Transposase IS204/IS1001/IS1096/IS1165 DDE domain-containing protein n=1 Tax=Microbacterium amylolyticum TaxID=936337 RepID=A0ABS4ZIH8_9MICO|nr:hypothetical protein [Microbacterium amylolyticum]